MDEVLPVGTPNSTKEWKTAERKLNGSIVLVHYISKLKFRNWVQGKFWAFEKASETKNFSIGKPSLSSTEC